MKKYHIYIISLVATCGAFASCEEQKPDFFDNVQSGVYFNYDKVEDLTQRINFGDHILDINEETGYLSIDINLKLIGHMTDTERRIVLKSKPIKDKEPIEIIIPEVVFMPQEYKKTVQIQIAPPAETEMEYAVGLYIDAEDPASQLGSGIEGFEEMTFYVSDAISEPDDWSSVGSYFGTWNKEKHIFLVRVTGDNNYAVIDYSDYDVWAKLDRYNKMAVDSMRNFRQAHPDEEVPFDIPFINLSYESYDKPYYWGEQQDKYFGEYSQQSFLGFCSRGNTAGSNDVSTINEEAYFTNDVISKHKELVELMGQLYNNYFLQGSWSDSFQWNFWMPMYFEELDYNLPMPEQWENELTSDMIKTYYGTYNAEKYKFMLKTAQKEATGRFVMSVIFPIRLEEDKDTGSSIPQWENEDLIRHYNQLFRIADENDLMVDFNFPIIQ